MARYAEIADYWCCLCGYVRCNVSIFFAVSEWGSSHEVGSTYSVIFAKRDAKNMLNLDLSESRKMSRSTPFSSRAELPRMCNLPNSL
jgi:hypothetical protein